MFSGKKINYCVVVWTGSRRRVRHPRMNQFEFDYKKDPSIILRLHMRYVKEFSTCLDQITIVVPHNDNEKESFTAYVKELASVSNVVVHRCPNDPIYTCFNAYCHAFRSFRDQFDYFMFVEDDYVSCQSGFDAELATGIDGDQSTAYVSACWYKGDVVWEEGMVARSAMDVLISKYNGLPFRNSIEMSIAFNKLGFNVGRVGFYSIVARWNNNIRRLGPSSCQSKIILCGVELIYESQFRRKLRRRLRKWGIPLLSKYQGKEPNNGKKKEVQHGCRQAAFDKRRT